MKKSLYIQLCSKASILIFILMPYLFCSPAMAGSLLINADYSENLSADHDIFNYSSDYYNTKKDYLPADAYLYTFIETENYSSSKTINTNADSYSSLPLPLPAPPTIICPGNIIAVTDPGVCTALVNGLAASINDPDGDITTLTWTMMGATTAASPIGGINNLVNYTFNTGLTAVTYTVTDLSGTPVSCSFTVTVNDTQLPLVTCPPNINTTFGEGECNATVIAGIATATDNCGVASVVGVRSDGLALNAPYPTGATTITWTATDIHGNIGSCAQTVTISQGNLLVNYNFIGATAYPISPNQSATGVTCEATSTEPFNILATMGTVSGNLAFVDNTVANPAIFMDPSNFNNTRYFQFHISGDSLYKYRKFKLYVQARRGNRAAQTINFSYSTDPFSYTVNGSMSLVSAGVWYEKVVDWSAVSLINNHADLYIRLFASNGTGGVGDGRLFIDNFQVIGVDGPLARPNSAIIPENTPVTIPVLGNDYYGCNGPAPVLPVSITSFPSQGSVALNPDGTITYTPNPNVNGTDSFIYQICDATNSCDTSIVNITINPVSYAPVVSCPGNILSGSDIGLCGAVVNDLSASIFDQDGNISSLTWTMTGANNASSPATGINFLTTYTFNFGISTITYVVADADGLTDTCSFTVNVYDSENPSMVCSNDTVLTIPACDLFTGLVTLVPPVIGDNCGILNMTNDAPPQFPIGNTSVIWTVNDINGNSSACEQIVTVNQMAPVNITTSFTAVSCFGGSNGSATALVSGGSPPYLYSWNTLPVQTTPTISNLIAGTYIVIVTDSDGCSDTASVTVTEPIAPLALTVTDPINVLCFGNSTGSITVTGNGGTPAYQYNINGGTFQVSGTFSNLSAGDYTVMVIDANSCTDTLTISITQPDSAVSVQITSVDTVLCAGQNTGNATALATGGVPPYSYSWNTVPVQNTPTATGLTAGTYTVSVTDANGCGPFTAIAVITELPQLTASASVTTPVPCSGGTATVTISASGGTAPYTYTFNGITQAGNGVFTSIPAGNGYAWSVTDSYGCGPVTGVLNVNEPVAITATASILIPIPCIGGTATIVIQSNGGTAPYTYTFNGVTQVGNGIFAGIPAGTAYAWSVTDANGCGPVTGTLDITDPPIPSASASVTTPILCAGGTATITMVAASGTTPYTFTFNGVTQVGNGVFTGIPAGPGYVWSVVDANGCGPVTGTLDVSEPPLLTASASFVNISPCGNDTATVTLLAFGGTAPYTYTFNGVTQAGNGVFTGILPANGYFWSVTDANGCGPVSGTLDVTGPLPLTASATISTPILCAGATATVTLQSNGGTAPISYTFNGVTQIGNGVFTGITPGIAYAWSVTDANACGPVTGTLDITEPVALTASAIVLVPIPCIGGTATITILANGGTAPLSYTFNGVTQIGNGVFTGIPAGTAYAWSVTDANNCGPITGTLDVISPPIPGASASVTIPILCAGGTATITIIAASGTAPYTYVFNGVTQVGNGVFTGIPAGTTYIWSVTDANGCGPVTGTLDVTEPPLPTASASVTTPILCTGGQATVTIVALNGILPYTYTFNGVTQVGNGVFTGISAGTGYNWSIVDANGCGPVTGILDVTEPATLTASASISIPIPCAGGSATVTLQASGGTAPYTFTFNGVTQIGNGVFTAITAGTAYAWSVTDANGCTPVTGSLDVTEPSLLTASALVLIPIPCIGGTATVVVQANGGTAPYTFTFNGVTQVGNGVFAGIPAGAAYTWSVTDANGCGPVSGTLDVIAPPIPGASASVTVPILCAGGTATITIVAASGTAPYTYVFNGVTQIGNGVFTGIATGSAYVWSVTDANGCGPVTGTLDVTEPALLTSTASFINDPPCGSGTATVTLTAVGGTAPYTYTFNGVTQVGNGVFTLIPTGSVYAWSVTDANSCGPVSGTLDVTNPAALTASAAVLLPIPCIGGTATIVLQANGGTPPYIFTFNGVTQPGNGVFAGIPAGTAYVWSVTDANGCGPVSGTLDVSDPPIITASASVTVAIPCTGGTATVTIVASNGNAPYTFTFNGVIQIGNGVFTGIPAGTAYSWSAADANGCDPVTGALDVTEPALITVSATYTNDPPCGSGIATVTLLATGGTAPYIYTFNGVTQAGNGVFTGIPAGSVYAWSTTDANACGPVTGLLNVTEPAPLTATAIVSTPVPCNGGTSTVTITATGGTAPYTFIFNGIIQTGNGVFTAIPAGSGYLWSVSDANGCGPFTGTLDVTEPDLLIATITDQTFVLCTGATTGFATVSATGGTPGYLYSWNTVPVQTTPTATNLSAGTYVVTVTDANGCTANATATITEVDPIIANAGPGQMLCNADVTFLVGNSPAPGIGSWAFVSGPNVPGLFPPIGSVAVATNLIASPIPYVFSYTIDNIGCLSIDTMSVINYNPPTPSYAGIDQKFCSATGNETTTLDANTPVFGTGVWTQLAGPNTATILDPSDPNTSVSNLTYGAYAFQWLISNGVCQATADVVNIFVSAPAAVDAGENSTICEGSTYSPGTATASNYSSLLWTSSGTGIFNDPTILNPIYTPSTTDITNGIVVLMLTAIANEPCPDVSDQITLIITRTPLVYAGSDASICGSASYTVPDATVQFADTYNWTSTGTGTLTGNTTLNPNYTPAPGETGVVLLILTGIANAPCTNTSDTMTINIADGITASAIVSTPILCSGGTATVTLEANGGIAPFTFTFNGVSQVGNGIFIGIPAGTAYTWIVTDASGCSTVTGTLDVTEPALLTAFITAQTFVLCTGTSTGFATVTATGGTPVYTYSWNTVPVQNTQTATNLSAGTYIVVVTDVNGCTASATATIAEADAIIANAGPGQMLCNADVTFLVGNSPAPGTGSWAFVSGPNVPNLFPPVGSVAVASGLIASPIPYVFSYSIDNLGCLSTDTMSVLNYTPPTPSFAGADQQFCNATGTLSTTLVGNTPVYGSGVWTQFSGPNTATILNPTDPNTTVSNLINGEYIFQWTISNGVCQSSTDAVSIVISAPASVNAGSNSTICEGSTHSLGTASASNYNSLLWTSTGTGFFNDPSLLNPVYTPSATDITNGAVTLILTATANEPCTDVSDQMTLTINRTPLVYAGSDATICDNSSYTVQDATIAFTNNYSWTTTGTGTLTASTTLNPTYTPASGETGNVLLILIGIANAPCSDDSDTLVLSIVEGITVTAGPDTTICENETYSITGSAASNNLGLVWVTSGSGTFDNPSILNPVYTPSPNDINDGFVFLTLTAIGNTSCPEVNDLMKLSFARQPLAYAGPDVSMCQSSTFIITQATASNYSSILWTTTGLGTLSGENTLEPAYTPATGESGIIILTLVASANTTACHAATDQVSLFIQQAVTVNAGLDLSTCELSPVPINGSSVQNSTAIHWSTSGNGSFSDPTIINPVYTPGTIDAVTGTVTLTLEAGGTSPCPDVSDQAILTINKAPLADAGPDITTCVGTSYTISQASASDYSSVQWVLEPVSAGTILNPETLSPTFTPAAGFTGVVSLTLKVQGMGTCGDIVISDIMNIYINSTLVANAGPDQTIITGGTTQLVGSVSGGSGFYAWNWQPSNLLVNASIQEPVTEALYTATTFTVTVLDISTGCADNDTVLISIGNGGNSIAAVADYDTTLINVPVTINVLANDINPEGNPMTVSLCGYPSYGLVVLNSDKTITYTPYAGYEGDDMFCYKICDVLQPALCADTMVYIHVKKPSLNDLFVFTGVSPNGDGNNDVWKIRGIQKYPDNTVFIFNRWGDKVHEFANYNNTSQAWNGTNENGELLPDGTYFYILDVKNVGVLKGWILLRGE